MKARGLTMIELLVTLTISVLVIAAAGVSYSAGINSSAKIEAARAAEQSRIQFEDQIRQYVLAAYISSSAADQYTYFIGDTDSGSTTNASQATGNNSNRLTFTTVGSRLPGYAISSETDFETLNREIGPQGGATVVSFSMTAVGTPPAGATGLFLRTQTPSDTDPTQGGNEQLFNANVTDVSFEFYDGANWDSSWNTRTGTHRIPAAVRITYHLQNDDQDYFLIVRIPNSDVTSANPVSQGATG